MAIWYVLVIIGSVIVPATLVVLLARATIYHIIRNYRKKPAPLNRP